MNHPHPPIGLAALLLVTTLIAGAASGPGLPTVAGTAATLRDSGQRLGGADTYGTEVVLGDVDRDGDIDAVVVGPGIPTRCWLNDGAGRFSDSGQDLGGNALGVALADLGVDGLPELISLHDESGGTVRVWVNTGAGTFRRRIERQVGGDLPSALQVGPLGGDSRADVLVVRMLGRPMEIWLTVADDDFAEAAQWLEADSGTDAALGDLDGDGDLDVFLAGANREVVWLNQGGVQGGTLGAFAPGGPAFGDGLTLGVALADLDGDGDLDAFAAESAPTRDRVWINQGGAQGGIPGRFADSGQRLGPGSGQSRDVALGDMDRDGDADAVVARGGGNRVYWNDGAGGFSTNGLAFGSGAAEDVALADLDGDGDTDVFVVKFGAPSEVWLGEVPVPPPVLPEYRVRTIAGNGTPGDGGDGGPALAASLESPRDLAVDARGVIYVADNYGERVRRIAPDGTISTLIGEANRGFAGDGGPVGQARFDGIRSVAVDRDGRLFVADVRNDRIRRIDLDGTVTTVAGNGGNLFGGDGGPATQATLRTPTVVRIDATGNLFLVDLSHGRVRRVDTNGIITTVAGNGGSGYSGDGGPATSAEIGTPSNLLLGPDGSLYLADESRARVRRVSPSGIISTVAGIGVAGFRGGGGPATAARLDLPWGLALDGDRNLFIGDQYRVRRVDAGGVILTVAGGRFGNEGDGGPALQAGFDGAVRGMAWAPGGDLLFCVGHRVRRLSPTGNTLPVLGRLQSNPAPGAEFDFGRGTVGEATLWREPRLRLDNTGTADLVVRSAEVSGDTAAFRMEIRDSLGGPVTLPHRIPEGDSGDSLEIRLRCVVGNASVSTNHAVLRIATNDPDRPVAEYALRATVLASEPETAGYQETQEESVLILVLFGFGRATALHGAPRPSDTERDEAVLGVDPAQPHTVTSEIPAYLGGGLVTISNFTGQVRVETRPDPQDAAYRVLTILGGAFTTPSFRLPNGIATGPTTLTFGEPGQSTGRLHRATGQYTTTASATIVNDLFPRGLPVRGSYSGTFDAGTGRAKVRSSSVDQVPKADQLQVVREGAGANVVWNSRSILEMATRLPGPWQPQSNAASPHALDLRSDSQRYYRLRQVPGR